MFRVQIYKLFDMDDPNYISEWSTSITINSEKLCHKLGIITFDKPELCVNDSSFTFYKNGKWTVDSAPNNFKIIEYYVFSDLMVSI